MSVTITDQERVERLQRENERLRARVNDAEEYASDNDYRLCLMELGLSEADMGGGETA
ncbi:MAG: hypothetical protein RSD95_13850 [Clostridia bacterium]